MSDEMNRRVFLGRAASLAAGGAVLGGLEALGQTSRPASEPALEWRNRQPTMAYAKLGRTNFMVSRCVFGAAGLYGGGKGDLRLLETAIERGVNYIDTARGYGQSESALAGILKKCRDKVWIVSKAVDMGFPRNVLERGEDARAAKLYTDQLEVSLKQLGVETIDCYMIQGVAHDWIVKMDSLYDAFTKARKAGKVRYFGLATHTNVQEVCELAAETGRYDVVQLAVHPTSLEELAPAIKKMRTAGIGVISMKTAGPIGKNPKVFDRWYDPTLTGRKLSPFQRAYVYMLTRGHVDAFNSHMPTREILEENLAVPTLKLAKADLDRIEAANPAINAIVSLRDRSDLMAEAEAADGSAARGWLHGLPVAVKDLVATKGLRTTYGSPLFRDFVPAADDLVAARLRAAGAILIGKTNTPEWGHGSHSFNPVHGTTRNPYDLTRTAGGSSGGAAAALAARMVPVADGSDFMGSLRNPAAFCNVYGFRPTWGLVPQDAQGDVFLHTLATEGPMARTIEDLARLLSVLAGPNPSVPFGRASEDFAAGLERAVRGLRIGWLGDWGGAYGCEDGILAACEAALAVFEAAGAVVEPVPPPFPAERLWDS